MCGELAFAIAFHAMTNYFGRIPTDDTEWRNIAGYDCSSTDDGALSDPPTLEHQSPLADPGKVLDHGYFDRGGIVGSNGLAYVVGAAILLEETQCGPTITPYPRCAP